MELTQEDVLQILKLLEASSVDYLEVQLGDMRLVASKSGVMPAQAAVTTAEPATTAAPPAAAPPRVEPPAPSAPAAPPTSAPAAQPAATAAAGSAPLVDLPPASEAAQEEGLVTVTAPVVGVFYVAPEPGAPPFVEVGSRVDEDTTMGLIEVMKMFNSVTAGVRGEVVRILAANEEFVEFGQPLFLVRPETAG